MNLTITGRFRGAGGVVFKYFHQGAFRIHCIAYLREPRAPAALTATCMCVTHAPVGIFLSPQEVASHPFQLMSLLSNGHGFALSQDKISFAFSKNVYK